MEYSKVVTPGDADRVLELHREIGNRWLPSSKNTLNSRSSRFGMQVLSD